MCIRDRWVSVPASTPVSGCLFLPVHLSVGVCSCQYTCRWVSSCQYTCQWVSVHASTLVSGCLFLPAHLSVGVCSCQYTCQWVSVHASTLVSGCLFQLSPNCLYMQTTIFFEIGSERFSCTGKVLLDPGFTEIMPWLALGEDEEIPTLKKNTMLDIEEVGMTASLCFLLRCNLNSNTKKSETRLTACVLKQEPNT